MSNEGPLVSVIMPTFNRHDLLPHAIESVLQQSYQNWELIVVDDGSTDGTHAYLSSLQDPRIRTFFHGHRGNIAAVRNAGIGPSRGNLIGFLDSDDVMMPNSLEVHVAQLASHPGRDWSYGPYQLMDTTGRDLGAPFPAPSGTSRDVVLRELVTGQAVPQVGGVVIRRQLLEKAGKFDEGLRLAAELDLWIRMATVDPGVRIDAVLVRVRNHQDRTTARLRESALHLARVYEKHRDRTSDSDMRVLCKRLGGEQLMRHAGELSRGNHPFRAIRTMIAAARLRGVPFSWWWDLVKILLRPLLARKTLRH